MTLLQTAVPVVPTPPQDYLNQLLGFFYTLAHWVGQFVVGALGNFLALKQADSLVDPLGFLVLITALFVVAEVAKKITWIIVVVGWVLIVLKIVLDATQP